MDFVAILSLEKFNSYIIIDDLLATVGTIECVTNLIRKNWKGSNGIVYSCYTCGS